MSESERRRKYRYNRVLIETARVLDPQFDDAVVFLTGAQIEMLRNVTQYLNRLDTYVSEQFPGYYLTPTAEEYDDVLAIVADLEEELMGNPNTIWGYKDTYSEVTATTYYSTGTKLQQSDAVPEGYVYVLTSIAIYFTTGTMTAMSVRLESEHYSIRMAYGTTPTVDVPLVITGAFPLKEGEFIQAWFDIATQPCSVRIDISGYKMVVP